MGKIKLITIVFVIGAVAAVLAWQHALNERLRQENESLRKVIAELKQPQESHEPTSNSDSMTKEQITELLKLRSEVTQLRERTNELAAVQRQNEQLGKGAASRSTNQPPPDVAPENIHPKESWAFAGYATPEAAMQSMLWGMSQTNKDAFFAGVDPDRHGDFKEENFEKEAPSEVAKMKSFRFLGASRINGDFASVAVYMEGSREEDKPETTVFLFKKNRDSWQLLGPAEKEFSRLHSGSSP